MALIVAQTFACCALLVLVSIQLHYLFAELRKGCNQPEKHNARPAATNFRTERGSLGGDGGASAKRANGLVCLSWAGLSITSICMFVFCLDPSIWGLFSSVVATLCNIMALLGVCLFTFFVQYLVPHVRYQRSAVRLKFLLLYYKK